MKCAYPIIISKEKDGYFVSIPDFERSTQGNDIPDAMFMARDAIGLMGIDMEDKGQELPKPNTATIEAEEGDIVTLVDVDFAEYRRKNNTRVVKKNCTIPSWLNEEAERAGVNFSRVLQEALMETLEVKQH